MLEIRDWAPDLIYARRRAAVQQIHTRVLPRRGVFASPDEIVITVGAQHALYLIADLLVDEAPRVGIENPGYPDARNIFASRTRRSCRCRSTAGPRRWKTARCASAATTST